MPCTVKCGPGIYMIKFVAGLRRCLKPTHLVLTRPDGQTDPINQNLPGARLLPSLEKVMLVNTQRYQLSDAAFRLPEWQVSLLGQLWLSRQAHDAESARINLESEPLLTFVSALVPHDRAEDGIGLLALYHPLPTQHSMP